MTRVDVREDGHGCDVIWDNTVRSAAVPKLSLPDNLITTLIRHKPLGDKHGTPRCGQVLLRRGRSGDG
jgi:hypothetical protein